MYIFLIENLSEENLFIQEEEIQEAKWFTPTEAIETIEYEGSRRILDLGMKAFVRTSGEEEVNERD